MLQVVYIKYNFRKATKTLKILAGEKAAFDKFLDFDFVKYKNITFCNYCFQVSICGLDALILIAEAMQDNYKIHARSVLQEVLGRLGS